MAVEPEDADFSSQLEEASKQRAKDELNELSDTDRTAAVQTFRQWILQQSWLRTPTDYEFLLRFLRVRKFSQLAARETIQNYWKCRTGDPAWFRAIDPSNPVIQEILRTGFLLCPKRLDKDGRRVIIGNMGLLTTPIIKIWGLMNIWRAHFLVYDWANIDENVQVNGMVFFSDEANLTMELFQLLFEVESTKRVMEYFTKALPCRMKGGHVYTESEFFNVVFGLLKPVMTKKAIDRVTLHGKDLASVYKKIDMACLPDEYLPDDYDGPRVGTRKQIIEDMIEDMMKPEFRYYITDLSSDKYGIDADKLKKGETKVTSFRRFSVD